MKPLLITLLLAVILIALALAGLALGLILTGKNRLQLGACGRYPRQRRDERCGNETHCPLCDKHESD
ncbi:MAG: hypothetical protein AB7F31_04890 [Parachlamydiales bacterium]